MGRRSLLERILSGRSDANIPFEQARTLLKALGFSESIRGSHHKFVREGVEELINLQEVEGKCKPCPADARDSTEVQSGGGVMMERLKYEIDIFWSEEDEGYIADVPDLKYCSAWGETYEEALREVRVAMELHLEVLEKTGRPIPEPRARQAS